MSPPSDSALPPEDDREFRLTTFRIPRNNRPRFTIREAIDGRTTTRWPLTSSDDFSSAVGIPFAPGSQVNVLLDEAGDGTNCQGVRVEWALLGYLLPPSGN